MIFKHLRQNIDIEDSTFNELYPTRIQRLSERHWTPVEIAKVAADYLVDKPYKKVLDIGAGAGKFCLVGAASTRGFFYGVEQRESLIKVAEKIAEKHNVRNVEFIHSNINQISFSDYDAFYFYNSFYENIDITCPIDKIILPEKELFHTYSNYVREQLGKTPKGTRLVTYWSTWEEIPESFDLEESACDGILNFWKKKS
ncbi:methyltransferase domain-containing protein [Flavobacterium hydatis]|uniref:SAM-dependent methyltransferase n=1 Tax=Flavobacterium hydatis TaxID=991 RepID=A0A086A1V5_FLAHY|nr:methyltransferase domain-containing protein [Flavobacterium hydatis]KFF10669.1 SAM-dependent methyltransferase [Flavobacterium hydatis]OXA94278.1 SAM-dependent methyltransferase [Flavobacterium hydatis]